MIKKIKSSLFAKVFIITSMILLCISLLVFGLLAYLMPQTYSNKLNAFLDGQTQEFIGELEKVAFSDSGGLFDQFIQNMEINSIELYDSTGMLMTLPTEQSYDSYGGNVAQAAYDDLDESNPVLSSNYYFSFLGSNDRYMLIVYGKAGQIAELQQSFLRIFPLLLIVVFAISLIASWLYSRIITKPVLEISRVSEKMSDLHFEWQVNGQRTDELGILGKSLNRLSQNLRMALTDLKRANAELEADIEREKA